MAKGSTVYVGNIDFDIPEQRVIDELSKIGRVVSFRMMIDKQTGKPKGYAFCEYESPLIAETAVQKLRITFNNRPLKINYADIETNYYKKENGTNVEPSYNNNNVEMPIDNLITVLNQMEKSNLKDVIFYLKRMAIDQPKKLKRLMDENVNLPIALLHSFVELGMVEQESIYKLLKDNFKIEDSHVCLLERVVSMNDDMLDEMEKSVKDKIVSLKEMFIKK